jgi:hypothetical protein
MKTKFPARVCGMLLLAVFWLGAAACVGSPAQGSNAGDEAADAQALFALLIDDDGFDR